MKVFTLTLKEEYRFRVFNSSAEENILDLRGWKWHENRKNYVIRRFIICFYDHILEG
jgi:hypothetical protein